MCKSQCFCLVRLLAGLPIQDELVADTEEALAVACNADCNGAGGAGEVVVLRCRSTVADDILSSVACAALHSSKSSASSVVLASVVWTSIAVALYSYVFDIL